MKFSFSHSMKWSIFISAVTFVLACVFSVSSTIVLEGVAWGTGIVIVLLLVMIGVFFDMLGLASAAAEETPFHAMASKKVKGARQAIAVVRNADRFSNFCNDVVGDVAGVISGAASAFVVMKLLSSIEPGNERLHTAVSVVFAGLVSALTVGGKAMGKSLAIRHATEIVLAIGKLFYVLEHRLHIKIFTRKKPKNGKRGD